MATKIPCISCSVRSLIYYTNRSYLSKRSDQRTLSWSALKPYEKRCFFICWDVCVCCSNYLIVHSALVGSSVPVNWLIPCIVAYRPANDWNSISDLTSDFQKSVVFTGVVRVIAMVMRKDRIFNTTIIYFTFTTLEC